MERYSAFISYRHCPRDIKIAAEIQKQLEHFSIPGAIRKSTGKKKISRVFRDKEELSLTGDLNETIQKALEQSDFLILICSHAMKESLWVKKEIEYFLKTHSKKQILTVIAEGEPCDVLPEILTYEEMVLPDADGELEQVKVPVEALSCDYRLPLRRARREELPRLAAAILGCSYNDLRRRQRQYRMRRIGAAVIALALLLAGLSVYFAWSAKQIQNNLNQALINQSEYLASESRSLLASGDRLSSVLLSLHALPQEGQDRPVVPSAINALSQATYAYVSPGNEKIHLDHMISPKGLIDEYCIDSREEYLFVQYDSYFFEVWDLRSNQSVYHAQLSTYISKISFSAHDKLLVFSDNRLMCIEPSDGTLIWEYTLDAYGSYRAFCLSPKGNIALYNNESILLLDALNGKLLQNIFIPEEFSDLHIGRIAFSADESHLAVSAAILADQLLIRSEADGSFFPYTLPEGYICHMGFGPDDSLYLATADQLFTYFTTDTESLYSKDEGSLIKLDPKGSVLWQTEINSFYSSDFYQFYFADYSENESTVPALMFCYSNLCCMFDLETGEMLSRVEFLGSVINAQQSDIGVRCLLSNGDFAICNASKAVVQSTPCFVNSNSSGLFGENIYILDEARRNILVYRPNIYDDNWQSCCTLDSYHYSVCERGILFSKGPYSLCLLDSESRQILWETETQIQSNNFSALGSANNGATAILYMYGLDLQDNYHTSLCLLDLDTGAQQYLSVDDIISSDAVCLQKDAVYYISCEYDDAFEIHYYIARADLTAMQTEKTEVCLADYRPETLSVSPSGKTVLLWDTRGQCAVFENGAFSSYLGTAISADYVSYSKLLTAVWNENEETIAVTSKSSIDLYTSSFEPICQIPQPDNVIGAIHFYGGKLLVVCDDKLYCYDAAGSFIAELDIVGASAPFDCTIASAGEGKVSLLIKDNLNLIDTSFWQCYTTVENCLHYDADKNLIFTASFSYLGEEIAIGYYREYSLQELMDRAYEQLDGLELTEEQINQYGVS